MSNPKVFFDIAIGGQPAGSVVMELYADIVPQIAEIGYRQIYVTLSLRRLTGKWLGLLATLVSILLTLLQLRFQSAKASPFETHRLHFIAFFTVILIFAVLMGIGIKLEAAGSGCPAILSTLCLFIGYLSLIPLLLIAEPYIGWTVFMVWFFFFVKWACESYEEMRDSIVFAVERATSSLNTLFNRNRNQNEEANISTNV